MKILIHHNAGTRMEHGNFGDLAMLQAEVDYLCRGIEGAELRVRECPCAWPGGDVQTVAYSLPLPGSRITTLRTFKGAHGIILRLKALTRRTRYATLGRGARVERFPMVGAQGATTLGRWCYPYNALVIAGGGALNDIFTTAFWTSSCLIHSFAAQGKPVVLTGQQLGPFRHVTARKLLHRTLRKASFIGLREATESLRLCEEAGVEQSRVAVMGDDSFGVAPASRGDVQARLSRLGLLPGRFIAVNIRLSDYTPSATQHLQSFARFLSALSRDYQLPLLFVPISIGKRDSDISAGYRLVEAIGNDCLQVLDNQPLSVELVKGVLGSAYAAIGMSYHFCTFALLQGVPAVALFAGDYYAQKARGLSRFWEDERLAESFASLETAVGRQRIRSVIDDGRLRETLGVRAEQAIRHWQMMFEKKVVQPLQEGYGTERREGHLATPSILAKD